MTNYEYLRSLSVEEMAEELPNLPICEVCEYVSTFKECYSLKHCSKAATEWLKSERETGGHNE